MCKWGPSRFREGGNVGHILKFLKSCVGSILRYFKGGMVWSQFLVLSERGAYFKKIEMRCIFQVAKCVSGDPLDIKRVAMLAIY